jgi:hypothetical protein
MSKKKTPEDIQVARDFINEIDILVNTKGMDYLEAVVYYCEKSGLEIESAASFIKHNSKMKQRLEKEARGQRLLKEKV